MLISRGVLTRAVRVFGMLADDGAIELVGLVLDLSTDQDDGPADPDHPDPDDPGDEKRQGYITGAPGLLADSLSSCHRQSPPSRPENRPAAA